MAGRLLTLSLAVWLAAFMAGCAGTGAEQAPGTTLDLGTVQLEAASGLTRVAIPSPGSSSIAFTGLYGARITSMAQVGHGLIAYASDRTGSADIYTTGLEGGAPTRLTTAAGGDLMPAWSPDGSKIAFASNRNGGGYEVYVMNADGSGQVRLTNAAGDDISPCWSPAGTKIAFSSNRTGNADIWVMNADGSSQTNLTQSPATLEREPSWSPDGRRIAFASLGLGAYDIWVTFADGTGLVQLTDDAGHDIEPSWSPDGELIAFATSRTGTYDIWVMAPDGWNQRAVTTGSAGDTWPDWSPDGSRLVFQRDHGAGHDVWVADANGANQRNITNDPTGDDTVPSWTNRPRVVRTLIGAVGTDGGRNPALGTSRGGVVLGITDRGLASAIAVTAPLETWSSITISALQGTGTTLAGVHVEGTKLLGIAEDCGTGLPPRNWTVPTSPTTTSVVVFLSAGTGAVTTVIGSSATAYAASARTPSPRVEGDAIVLEGSFSSVCTAADPARNAAPSGASRIVLDAATGEVRSFRP